MIFYSVKEEERIIDGIPFPKSAGFGTEAVEPLHAKFLNKHRSLFYLAGVKGKRRTNAKIYGRRKGIEMVSNPFFLLGAA